MKAELRDAALKTSWPSARHERQSMMTTKTPSFRDRVAAMTAEDVTGDDGTPQFEREEGAIVSGAIVEFRDVTTSWGDTTIMRVNDEETGLVDVWLSGSVLTKWREEMQPQVGETVGLKCLGKQPTKDGSNSYWNYYVEIDGRPRSKAAQAMNNPAQTKLDTGDGPDPFEDE